MITTVVFNESRRKVLRRETLSTRINTELDLRRNIISKIDSMTKKYLEKYVHRFSFEFIIMLSYSKAISHFREFYFREA